MEQMNIELRHLRYFVAVAEDLSFTRAASRLALAQPALSQQIRQLETRIGAPLFSRTPRVALTPAGAGFLTAARRTLADVRQAAEAAARVTAGEPGVLHVGLASSAALSALPGVVREFAASRRHVAVRLHEMHSADQVDAIRRGALDVAVLREPIRDVGLTSVELFREPFVLAVPRQHPLLRRRLAQLAECADEPFVLFPRRVAPLLYDQVQAICREAGFTPRIESEALEWHTIIALVAAGFGLSIAPASVAALRIRGARLRPLPVTSARAVLYLGYDKQSGGPVVRDFVRFARRRMRLTD
jgi:DNA-binding transcriptional LysR family regulator